MTFTIQPAPTSGPLFEGAIRVYGDAFARPPYSDPDRGREVRQRMRDVHALRKGFRLLVAVDERNAVVGMIYGYHGESGQWWHDTVVKAVPACDSDTWLSDSYELVEVGVDPGHQDRGIGTALIAALLEGRPETTCVLSTRTDSRAHELYSRLGFEMITEMEFTRGGYPFYVMGLRLPH